MQARPLRDRPPIADCQKTSWQGKSTYFTSRMEFEALSIQPIQVEARADEWGIINIVKVRARSQMRQPIQVPAKPLIISGGGSNIWCQR